MQAALDEQWPLARQLFWQPGSETALVAGGVVPPAAVVLAAWHARVAPWLAESGLRVPEAAPSALSREQHTPHLAALLADFQQVARLDPGAEW
jgi:ring-1,2-phenylacetyl-CoA epoxidase subunit PaaC